jgi:hypothetical protein
MLVDVPQTEPQAQQVEVQPGEVVVVVNPEKLALQQRIATGAGWFRTVGFFAVVNSLLVMAHIKLRFVFALGITWLAAAAVQVMDIGIGGPAGALLFACLGLAGASFFARFAQRGFVWAFVAGMVLYVLDGLIVVYFQVWLEVICHSIALWGMFGGLMAAQEYNRRFPRA